MMIFTFIPPQLLLLWCALIKLPLSQASGSQCFRPNRDLASFDYPCEPSHSQSFCCGVGWLCAYDKVCYPTIQLGEGWTAFPPTSGSCTDISWESSECPKRCLSTNLDSQDGPHSFYKCPDSNPPTYCCHEEGCNCDKGAEFKLPSAASISLIANPLKSSMVSRSVTRVSTVDDSQTITSNLVSVVTVTDAPTYVLVATHSVVPSATSQQSTSISGAQVTSSQSPQVYQNTQTSQASQAGGAAPTTSGARNFNVNFVVPAVALAISALVLLLLHH